MSQQETMSVSLIVATIGRTEALDHLLSSIASQSFQGIEVIIVDQNPDDRIKAVIEKWQPCLCCIHARSPRGLSIARNAGIQLASGTILGFPDDDCWYPPSLLFQVSSWFDQHPDHGFLCGSAQDERGRQVASRWPRCSVAVNRASVLRACASASFFIRKAALDGVGGFDERLGLGAATPFQSGEDSDLALRCLARGRKGWFEKQLHVYHPHKGASAGSSAARAFAYGMGFGCLLRMHGYSPHTLLYHVLRPLGGMVKCVLLVQPARAQFYWGSALGRMRGYLIAAVSVPSAK